MVVYAPLLFPKAPMDSPPLPVSAQKYVPCLSESIESLLCHHIHGAWAHAFLFPCHHCGFFCPTSSFMGCTCCSPDQRSSSLSLTSPFMVLFSLVHTHAHTRTYIHTHTCKFSTHFVNFPVLKNNPNSLSPWGFVPFFASLHIKTSKKLCLYSFPALLSHFFGTHRIKALSPGIPSKSSVQGHWWLPLLGYMY